MRKVLIATIVAMVLFAVGAFAAALTIDDSNLASGSGAVKSCSTANPKVEFKVAAHDGTDWPINGAKVTATGCPDGTEAEIVIGATGAKGKGTITSGVAEFSISGGTAYANPTIAYQLRLGGILTTP